MKKILFLVGFLLIPLTVNAKEINIYLFYGDGCSHCAALEKYLETKDNINLYKYEIWFNKENENLLKEVSKITGKEAKGVPYYIIGEETLQGYNDNEGWEKRVDESINKALESDFKDEVGIFLGKVEEAETINEKEETVLIETKEENEKKNNNIIYAIIGIAIIDIVATSIYLYKKSKKRL